MRYTVLPIALIVCISQFAGAQSPSPQAQQDLQRYYERTLQGFQQGAQGGGGRGAAPGPVMIRRNGNGQTFFFWDTAAAGAWWTNAALVTKLGLTDDQKTRIQHAFENRRQNLTNDSTQLDKQEAQLAVLLAADPVDHNAVLSQVDRVAQARADLERTSSAMTLEMREVLTAAQWQQLQSQPRPVWLGSDVGTPGVAVRTPFGDATAPAGARGQRSGQRQQ